MSTDLQQEILRLRTLAEAGQRAADAGAAFFVLWGVLAAAGAVATHLVLEWRVAIPLGIVWGVVLAPAWFLAGWLAIRQRRRAVMRTVSDRFLASLWLGCAVAITATASAAAGDILAGRAVAGVTALMLGAGYCATSAVVGRWLVFIAASWWLGGLVLLLAPRLPTLLVFAGLLIALQIVPGVVLIVRSRRRT
jgi:hypothetical protein